MNIFKKIINTCHGTTFEAQPSAGMLKVFIEQLHSQLSWNQVCSKVTHCWEREKDIMGCLQGQTSTSHSFFVSTKTTANSRGEKHLQTFDILALWPWNRPTMVNAAPVKWICCTETSLNGAPVPPNTTDHHKESRSSSAQHQMMNTWPLWQEDHFWPLAMVKGENRRCVWRCVYGQSVIFRRTACASEIQNKSAFGGQILLLRVYSGSR